MSAWKFIEFRVKRYRSLLDVKIDVPEDAPVVICGENNIGKTNLLRALNIYFNHHCEEGLFSATTDIPHHIFHGSQSGSGSNTELTGVFKRSDGGNTDNVRIKIVFSNNDEPSYYRDDRLIDKPDIDKEIFDVLSSFKFLFIESHNVNLPQLISAVLERDGLLPLDAKRSKQSKPLNKLQEFIKLSQRAIADIEKEINVCFENLTDFDGILKDKKIKIKFAEFEKLRDIVKTMTEITLHDGNSHGIASKGSGAQRAVFLSLMQFISKHSKQSVIWGIDEPEAFLQPRLQKMVASVFADIALNKKQPIILTTHSQHFVRLNNLKSTHLFKGELSPREYKRKPGQQFYEMSATPIDCESDYEKASLIKEHLGINSNDGWEVLPYNIIVEGEEDKKYLEVLFQVFDFPISNIVWSGGASKIGGYLQYYNNFAEDLTYKPKFICIFDNDEEGRTQRSKINVRSYKHMDVSIIDLPRHDGVLPGGAKKADWEIEDFLPCGIVFAAINKILRKSGYKAITQKQENDKVLSAHIEKQILKYAEECSSHNNPDKTAIILDDDGRKKQICQIICSELMGVEVKKNFVLKQINFLKEIAK